MDVIMVYDLETVPDVDLGRKLLSAASHKIIQPEDILTQTQAEVQSQAGTNARTDAEAEAEAKIQTQVGAETKNPDEMSDAEVASALYKRRLEQTRGATDFLPHHLHRIVAISVVVKTPDWVKVWSLGETSSSEKEIVERFFDGIEKYTPTLVSWNGCNFDLPVLHYRAMLHGIQASRYWDLGEKNNEFRWNNYINRYHQRHTDLMDVLSCYQRGAPLNEIAIMLGLPGKMGMDGKQVWGKFQAKDIQPIRDYCETDVLNTYIIYLHFCHMRGHLSTEELNMEIKMLKESLKALDKPYLNTFLHLWGEN